MKPIELNSKKLNEMMKDMPDETRQVFEKLLLVAASKAPLNFVKKWIDKFEDDCPVDNLILRILSQIIDSVGEEIAKDMKLDMESGSPGYSGRKGAAIAIAEMRAIADEMERHIIDDCTDCSPTMVKH